MFNLTRDEKLVIIFLSLITLLGVGANYYKKVYSRVDLKVGFLEISESSIGIDQPVIKAELIDINKAGPEELMRLPGIGAVIAARIVDYRNARGSFKRIEDITGVKGIGGNKFSRIKESLIVR